MSYSAIKLARDQYINQLLLRWVPNSNECGVDDVTFAEHVGGFKEIMKAVGNGVAKLEERFEFYCKCIPVDFDNKKSVQMLTQSFTHMEEYLMYICRDTWMREQRSAYQSPKEEGPGFLHQGVFTEILNDLIQDVNLDSTTIMDSLIQDELMTEDERQSVIKETTPRRRKEQLVYLMRGRLDKKTLMSQGKNPGLRALGYLPDTYRIPTQPWDSFIPAIGRDYPAVAEKIKATTEEIQLKCLKYQLCEICSMKEAIQAKSLADHLLRKQWITLDLYEDLRRDGDSNTTKWSSLLSKVSNPVHILEALEAKHPNFYNHLTISKFSDLECKCHENKNSTNIENYAKSDVTATADVANMDDFLSVMDENETLASTTKPIIDSPMDLDYLLNQIISLIHQFRPGLSVRNASAGNTQNGLQQTDVFYPISHQNWPSYSISTPLQTQRQFFVPTHIPPPRLPAQSPTNQQAAYYMYNGTPSNAHTEFSSAPQHGMCDSRPITSYVAVPGVNSNRMPGTHYVMATYSNAGTNGVSIASKPNICGRSTTSSDQVLAPRQFANFRNTFEQSPTVPVPVSTAMTSLDPSITEDTNTGIPISSNSSGLSLNTMTLNPAKSMIQSENTMKDQELQQEPLTASMLASELPQKQKELLGNRLFPFIKDMNPAMAGKITGMLLELDNIELLHMLESTESLTAKVDEAVAVIEAYAAKEATSMNRKDVRGTSATSLDASIIEDTNLGLPGSSSSSALSLNTMALNPSTAMKQSENKEKDQELQQEPLTATMLATESPQKQKEMLGNRLFPLIKDMNPAMAGKITGMLLELDNVELLHMLESAESLTAKVDEAVAVIEAHTAKEAASMNRKS